MAEAASPPPKDDRRSVHDHPWVLVGAGVIATANAVAAIEGPLGLTSFVLVTVSCAGGLLAYYRLPPGPWRILVSTLAGVIFVAAMGLGAWKGSDRPAPSAEASQPPAATRVPAAAEPSPQPVSFEADDLKTVTNDRYNFSVQVPKTWFRLDPANSDGWTFQAPDVDGVAISAYGSHPVLSHEPADPVEYIDEVMRSTRAHVADLGGAMVADGYAGGYAYAQRDDGTEVEYEVPGSHYEYTLPETDGRPAVTVTGRSIWAENHVVAVEAQAPTGELTRYRAAFRDLLATVHASVDCLC
ncbi:hypothetical protein [Modestobacter sp. URMC 112]